MKRFFTLLFLSITVLANAQLQRVVAVPAKPVYCIYEYGDKLYAGAEGVIYTGKNDNTAWGSLKVPHADATVERIIRYNDILYAATYEYRVYCSFNEGRSWEQASSGIDRENVSAFCVHKGNLYASTYGAGIFQLNNANKKSWTSTGTLFPASIENLKSNGKALIATTSANGMLHVLENESAGWQTVYVAGTVVPLMYLTGAEVVGSTFYVAAAYYGIYRSIDNGKSWQLFNNRIVNSLYETYLAASKNAVFSVCNSSGGTRLDYKLMNGTLASPMIGHSSNAGFTFQILLSNKKIWHARLNGLYYENISAIAGIEFNEPKQPEIYIPGVGELYPNPANKTAFLNITDITEGYVNVNVYNSLGALVASPYNNYKVAAGSNILQINVANMQSGIYFVKLSLYGVEYFRKLVVQH